MAKGSISIKELHAKTGELVRRASRSRTPVLVTDRGRLVAALIPVQLLPKKRRTRTLIPEYAALFTKSRSDDVLEDLDATRSDR